MSDTVELRHVEAGSGPAVVLLHGFPDFSRSWRFQFPALAAAGYRAMAPDLRGYHRSPRPPRVADYAVELLVADVIALAERRAPGGVAALVGHDWGGVVAWHAAAARPDLFPRLAILNAPHPSRFRQLLRGTAQVFRSWYAAAFQLPFLPEALLAAGRSAILRRTLRRSVRNPAAFPDDELDRYAAAFDSPAAFRGPVNYYRAAARRMLRDTAAPSARVTVPVLVLWGDGDPHLDVRNTEGLEPWVRDLTVVRFPRAGHWVHLDEPDAVNRRLLEFLGGGQSARSARNASP